MADTTNPGINPVPNVGTPLTDGKGNTNQQWWTFWARLATQAIKAVVLVLKTNGVLNGSQTLLNLIAGAGVTLSDDGAGGVTIAAVTQLRLATETPAGTMDSTNVVFTVSHDVQDELMLLQLNGVDQQPGGVDYTFDGHQTITFTVPPKSSDYDLRVFYARAN